MAQGPKKIVIKDDGEEVFTILLHKPGSKDKLLEQLKRIVALATSYVDEDSDGDPDSLDLEEVNVTTGTKPDLWDGDEDEPLETFLAKGTRVSLGDVVIDIEDA